MELIQVTIVSTTPYQVTKDRPAQRTYGGCITIQTSKGQKVELRVDNTTVAKFLNLDEVLLAARDAGFDIANEALALDAGVELVSLPD